MAITTQERTNILKLTVGLFNAAPGANYLSEFTSVFEANGHNLPALANTLGTTGAFQSLYPNFQTASEFATKFLTTLGLQGKTEAVDFVTLKFNAGVPKAQIIFDALVALDASTSAEYADARAILVNKAAVAENYSVTLGASSTSLATLQGAVANVTADAASVTAANAANAGGNGQTFTLTANQDAPGALAPSVNTQGTSGNDTYIGVIENGGTSTLQATDNIDGGAGVDTLQIIASGNAAGGNTVTPLFLKNVEKVWVKDVDATAVTTVNLANATGVTEVISDASVTTVNFQNIGAAALTAKNISTAGVTTTATLGTSPVTTPVVINLEKLGTEDAVGAAAVSAGRVVINDTNADNTAATINVAAGTVRIATVGALATSGAAAINLSGQDSTGVAAGGLAAVFGTHTVSALTINATGDLTVSALDVAAGTATAAIQGFDTTKAASITVTGAGKVDMGLLAGAVKTVNASAATGNVTFTGSTYSGSAAGVTNGLTVTTGTGNDSVTLSGVATASANTGAGNDSVIVVGGTLTAGAVLNGGDGTDTLGLSSADAVAAGANSVAGAALRSTYSNFETLLVTDALGAQLEAGRLGFGSSVAFNTALTAGGQTINGLVDGATLTFRAAANNTQVYTATVTDAATTTNDTLNLNLAANLASNENFAVRVAINGVNNIVVNANDRVNNVVDDNLAATAADNGASEGYTLFLTNAASLNTVTAKGTSQLIYAADASSTALKTVDATASTGNNTLDVAAFVGLERVTVNAGNGTNIINGSNTTFGDALNGGTGRDTIDAGVGGDAVKGNGGRDTFIVNTAAAASDSAAATTGFDKISDFGAVTEAITAPTNLGLTVGGFAAVTTNPGGANADVFDLTIIEAGVDATNVTVPTLGGLEADINVNIANLQAAAGTDIVAGDLITASESAKGVITLGGAAAAKVNTLAEWIAVADTMAQNQGDVVAFVFSGNTYLFEQGATSRAGVLFDTVGALPNVGVSDIMVELTGLTGIGGTVGITVVGTSTAAAIGDIFVG